MASTEEPILASFITLPRRNWSHVTIELYRHEIVLCGWKWVWPVLERIPIDDVTLVEMWERSTGPNFCVHTMSEESAVFGRIHKHSKFWEAAFEIDDRTPLKVRECVEKAPETSRRRLP